MSFSSSSFLFYSHKKLSPLHKRELAQPIKQDHLTKKLSAPTAAQTSNPEHTDKSKQEKQKKHLQEKSFSY